MKAKELVQEGPLDFAGKVAAGIKGAFDKTQTASGAWNVKAQQQATLARAKRDFAVWNKTEADLISRGVQPAKLGPYLDKWIAQMYPTAKASGALKPLNGPYTQPTALQHIQQALVADTTSEFDPEKEEPAPPPKPNPQQQAEPEPQQQASPTPTPTPEPQQQAAPTPEPQQQAAPEAPKAEVDPAHAMFKDPAAFKAEWDKFVASKPNYNLITDPALLAVLKNMWMRSGGVKAESKKNKGQRV
jgi:outer membrane biosynthesis protein TonB